MNNPFRKFFEEDQESVDLTDCHQILDWARCPYHNIFMAYLERGTDAKIDVATATSMLASSERINTFKDIRAHIRKQLRDAQEVIDREARNE